MTNQLFSPGTVVSSPWLNDVNTGTYDWLTSVAGTNTITASGPLAFALVAGNNLYFVPAITNTGAVTLSINSLTAAPITKYGSTPLVAGDLVAGASAELLYDGTRFQLLNPQVVPIANGGTGATTVAAAQTALNVAAIGPTFSVNRSTTQALTNNSFNEVVFTAALFDTTSAVNLSTGRFTPNVAGYYHFDTSVLFTATGGVLENQQVNLYKNGVSVYTGSTGFYSAAQAVTVVGLNAAGTIFLNGSTDYVSVFVYTSVSAGSATAGGSATPNYFTGHFLHP